MHVGLGRLRRGSRPEGKRFSQRNKQVFDGFTEVSTMHVIRLGASSEVPDKKDFEESKNIQDSHKNLKFAMLSETRPTRIF